jgi:hypothetical protein
MLNPANTWEATSRTIILQQLVHNLPALPVSRFERFEIEYHWVVPKGTYSLYSDAPHEYSVLTSRA